ncbi:hypothetical protein CBM2638_U30001 [Cupriavidus taiwanensis]|nr:hypothetical protein CBM2638_U30001 [Cupriavidus taiwanensis]
MALTALAHGLSPMTSIAGPGWLGIVFCDLSGTRSMQAVLRAVYENEWYYATSKYIIGQKTR